MSKSNPSQNDPDNAEYIQEAEIAEIVTEDVDANADYPMSDDEEGETEAIEIDLCNNSSAYFDEHKDGIFLVATHPELPLVVTGSGDEIGYLWTTDTAPPTIVTKLTGHTESLVAGGFTFDGKFVVTGDMNGQVRVWRSNAGGKKWEFFSSVHEVDEVLCIKFHPRLPVFAIGAKDGSVWVYELGSQMVNLAVLSAHSLPVNDLLFIDVESEDKITLISASEDGALICWNVYENRALYHLTPRELHGEHPWVSLCWLPRARTFAAGSLDGLLLIIKTENGGVVQSINIGETVKDEESRSLEAIAWCDKARILAVGNVAGDVRLYDTNTWKVRSTIQLDGAVTKLVFLPNSTTLVGSGYDSTLKMWNAVTTDVLYEAKGHNAGILGFAIQNGGKRLISAGEEGVSLVFNVDS